MYINLQYQEKNHDLKAAETWTGYFFIKSHVIA